MKRPPMPDATQPDSSQGPRPDIPAPAHGLRIDDLVDDSELNAALRPQIVDALGRIFDPEIPVNIYELGLIYGIVVDRSGTVGIRMTLTAPACPAAQFLPQQVHDRVAEVPGVTGVTIEIVWDPPWDKERMSDAARLQLGLL